MNLRFIIHLKLGLHKNNKYRRFLMVAKNLMRINLKLFKRFQHFLNLAQSKYLISKRNKRYQMMVQIMEMLREVRMMKTRRKLLIRAIIIVKISIRMLKKMKLNRMKVIMIVQLVKNLVVRQGIIILHKILLLIRKQQPILLEISLLEEI